MERLLLAHCPMIKRTNAVAPSAARTIPSPSSGQKIAGGLTDALSLYVNDILLSYFLFDYEGQITFLDMILRRNLINRVILVLIAFITKQRTNDCSDSS